MIDCYDRRETKLVYNFEANSALVGFLTIGPVIRFPCCTRSPYSFHLPPASKVFFASASSLSFAGPTFG